MKTEKVPYGQWYSTGRMVWVSNRDTDRIVAECDRQDEATLIAAAPALLELTESLLAHIAAERRELVECCTLNEDLSTADEIDRQAITALDKTIDNARAVIARAKGETND